MRNCVAVLSSVLALCLPACNGAGEVAGTYVIAEGQIDRLVEQRKAALPGEVTPEDEEKLRRAYEAMEMELTLEKDGKFRVAGNLAGEIISASGTWTLTGDKVQLIISVRDGQPQDRPKVESATWKDGKLTIEGDDMLTPIILEKR